jgi:hypothetical protein
MRSAAESRLTPSVEDKYLAGASLHPPEGSKLTTSPPRQELVANWLLLTNQSHYAMSISQFPEIELGPHASKELSSRTEGLAILFRS